MLTVSPAALEGLAALLLERAGLRIARDGFRGLRWALQERMPALGLEDADAYVRHLREPGGESELRALLPLVTVTHTEFFRDARQLLALDRRILPEALERARAERRPLRIWSAGCATGEEPYSLAMLLDEAGARPDEVDLWATDLNQAAIESARAGRFSKRRVMQVPEARRRRYFAPIAGGDGYELMPALRERVRFETHNLASPSFPEVAPERMDLILCRNVIIYFDQATIRALLDRFFHALRPGAFLVLGYSESLFRVYERFEMVEVDGAFLYRRPPKGPPKGAPKAPQGRAREWSPGATAAPPPQRAEPPSTTPHASAPARLKEAERCAEAGRFDEALAKLKALLDDAPHHLPARLSLGNLWSLMGQVDDAQRVFDQVLVDEPLCVEARIFAAMAQLQVDRPEPAREELRKALFLEPTLALAHYLSAQVHERLGDRAGARRGYRNALSQLRQPQRPLAGFYPELPDSPELIFRAAQYALAALEDGGIS